MFIFQICDRVLNGYRSTHTKRTHGDVHICSACCSTRDCNQGRCDVIRRRKIILCMLYGRKFRKQNPIDNWNWYKIILVFKWEKKSKKKIHTVGTVQIFNRKSSKEAQWYSNTQIHDILLPWSGTSPWNILLVF